MIIRTFLLLISLLSIVFMSSCGKRAEYVTIGTGGISGVYYPVGGHVATIINKKAKEYNLRVTHQSTGGSVFNINAVLSGDLEFGIAQSDRQYQAVQGLAEWQELGPQKDLRAVFSIHYEAVNLVVAADAGINSLNDLKDKRINIGNPGSGQRQNAIDALRYSKINYLRDLQAEGIKAAEAPSMLQDSRIDGFFYTAGHPNAAFKEVSSGNRKVKFIPITGIEALFKDFPYYTKTMIPISHYPNFQNTIDIPTIGVKATLITSAKVPERTVYIVIKEVFENLDKFKERHIALSVLTKEKMIEGLSAPFHAGALKYLKEKGLK